MEKLLLDFQDTLKVALGAIIALFGIVATSYLQNRTHKGRMREEMLLRAIQLAISSNSYARSIMYSKVEGISAQIKLPENPVDQLMAVIMVHFPTAIRLSNKLHLQQQKLFSIPVAEPDTAEQMLQTANAMADTTTEIVVELRVIAQKEGMGRRHKNTIVKGSGTASEERILSGERFPTVKHP
jgi:hypothetical protein